MTSSNKKNQYRRLISSLNSIGNSIDEASSSVDSVQDELGSGILINGLQIETDVFSEAKSELEEAKNSLYRASRSCYSSMSRIKDEE